MSEIDGPAREPQRDQCSYPGCTRPRRPDPSTGRPTRYCEQADDAGGPVHNRANAWKARRAREGAVIALDADAAAAPVSLARATLEQRLAELPGRFADLRSYLDEVVSGIRDAGDIEAAGAEVEDAHRDALSKITDAERRAASAERAARLADERTEQANRDREEADLLAEESAAEVEHVREETQAEIAAVRADADAAVAQARSQLAQATAEYDERLTAHSALVEAAQQQAAAARVEAGAAVAARQAAEEAATRERETVAQLRRELEQMRHEADQDRQRWQDEIASARQSAQQATSETAAVRVELATAHAEVQAARRAAELDRSAVSTLTHDLDRHRAEERAERDALRAEHTEQLAQAQRSADDRVHALTEALDVAKSAAETYRTQLAGSSSTQPSTRPPRRKGTTA